MPADGVVTLADVAGCQDGGKETTADYIRDPSSAIVMSSPLNPTLPFMDHPWAGSQDPRTFSEQLSPALQSVPFPSSPPVLCASPSDLVLGFSCIASAEF